MERRLLPSARVRTAAAWGLALALLGPLAHAQLTSAASLPPRGTYVHFMVFEDLGDSIRFNNPYRLSNQLGDTGESLSRTPVYNNLGGAITLGDPNRWQHGLAFQWSRSLAGLPQHVITPSYILAHGGLRPWIPYARIGVPVVLNPDGNAGGELALGACWMFLAGIGLHAELIGDVFYGAATWTTGRTTIPLLSAQLGISIDYEVLP